MGILPSESPVSRNVSCKLRIDVRDHGERIVLTARTFTAIDISESGRAVVDEFVAAHPAAAARRAQFAAEGVMLQLWSDGQLVGAWRRVGRRSFQPA